MSEITTVGLDLAKNVFQVHGADASGRAELRKTLRRDQVLAFFSQLQPCVVAMEACGGAQFWGREIGKLGHEVLLIPPAYVKPFVKRQKNDAADAEAICEAAQRPTMRFVPVKSEPQGAAMIFLVRELLIRQRTQAINALRGHLTEFGQIVPQGAANAAKLIAVVEDPDSGLALDAIATLKVFVAALTHLEAEIGKLDAEIVRRAKASAAALPFACLPSAYRPWPEPLRSSCSWLPIRKKAVNLMRSRPRTNQPSSTRSGVCSKRTAAPTPARAATCSTSASLPLVRFKSRICWSEQNSCSRP